MNILFLEGLTLQLKVIPRQRSWSSPSVSPSVVTATTPSKIYLHSNFGAYPTVISSVALVVKFFFESLHIFQVFLFIPKCCRIVHKIYGALHCYNTFVSIKGHFWSQSHTLCLLYFENVCKLVFWCVLISTWSFLSCFYEFLCVALDFTLNSWCFPWLNPLNLDKVWFPKVGPLCLIECIVHS